MTKYNEESFKEVQIELLEKRRKRTVYALTKNAQDEHSYGTKCLAAFMLAVSIVVAYLFTTSWGYTVEFNLLALLGLLVGGVCFLIFVVPVFILYNHLRQSYNAKEELQAYIKAHNEGSEDLARRLGLLE